MSAQFYVIIMLDYKLQIGNYISIVVNYAAYVVT